MHYRAKTPDRLKKHYNFRLLRLIDEYLRGQRWNLFLEMRYLLTAAFGLYYTVSMALLAIFLIITARKREKSENRDRSIYENFSITVIIPACDEQTVIVGTVKNINAHNYPGPLEIIVVDDDKSKDENEDNTSPKPSTSDCLVEAFKMEPAADVAFRENRLAAKPIRRILYKKLGKNTLYVIDKDNGGKSDALNAGINICSNDWFVCVDADTYLCDDAFMRLVDVIIDHPDVIAVGGRVRPRQTKVNDSLLTHILGDIQLIEYVKAFLLTRPAFDEIGGLLLISGAFGIFRTKVVAEISGYSRRTKGEDFELTIRLQNYCRYHEIEHGIRYCRDAVCETLLPINLRDLCRQRS